MLTYLWGIQQLCSVMGGETVGKLPDGIKDITIDSREVPEGSAFFAIKGPNFDGHEFASEAYNKGACLLILDKLHKERFKDTEFACIFVDDVLKALEDLAIAARARSRAKIIALTGSVGKTTTKEMLRIALSYNGQVHANPASFNNHWGVPLTLARMPIGTKFGIFEIGMNHANEIRPLVRLVRPHLALITKIAPAHLSNFETMENIVAAKAEIFEGVLDNGIILLNADDPYFEALKFYANNYPKVSIHSFGRSENADYRLLEQESFPLCTLLTLEIDQKKAKFRLESSAQHNAQNAVAAIAAIAALGINVMPLLANLSDWKPIKGRGVSYKLENERGEVFTLIDESYNANPTSMAAALDSFSKLSEKQGAGRCIAILGDMLELGVHSENFHRGLFGFLVSLKIDYLFLIGQNMRFLHEEIENSPESEKIENIWRANVEEILPLIENKIQKDDVIFIKSSHGVGSFKIVQHFLQRYKKRD